MTRTNSLPLELVDMILSWARLEPEKVYNRTLVACSYVCKAWQARAQALIFRNIPISLTRHQLSLLGGALSQCPELGQHIRSFGVEINHRPDRSHDDLHKGPSRRFRQVFGYFIAILTHSPNLVRLTIDVDGEFDSADISKLASINLRHIHTLNWEGQPTSSVLYSLLTLWPSIRYLYINNLQLDPPPEQRCSASLHSLYVCHELPESFMTWLVPTDDERPLRDLYHFMHPLSFRALEGVLLHASTLLVLGVDDFPPQNLLDALTALNELAFCKLPSVPVQLPRSVWRVWFHNRERLRRHWDDKDSPESLDKMGHLITGLMDLPKLTLVRATYHNEKDNFAALEKFCEEKKVKFDVAPSGQWRCVWPWDKLI